MMLKHWSDVYDIIPKEEWKKRWPNFSPQELACSHKDGEGIRQDCEFCGGEFWYDPNYFNKLQAARTHWGKPFKLNSAHRCEKRNHMVGGAKKSEHLRIATDIAILNRKHRRGMLTSLYRAGITTFGLYNSFIHADPRPWRLWIMGDKRIWQTIYDEVVKRDD